MKRFYFFSLLIAVSGLLNAQSYNFTKTTGTYTVLSSPTVVSTSTPWTSFQSHTVPIGFNFGFFDQTFSTIYIEGSGFTRFDASYLYLLNPFTVQMQDAGTGGPTSLSPLSYELAGTIPNRILKIQWENCEMVNDPGSFANFQLWLYETNGKIEIHCGNINVINPANAFMGHANNGPVVGLFDYVQNYGFAVNGAPPSESMITPSGLTTVFDYSMSGVPVNGTIYSFEFSLPVEPPAYLDPFYIFPNPSAEEIRISCVQDVPYRITSLSGQIVQQGLYSYRISIESIHPGIYILDFTVDGKTYSRKLIKE